VPRVDLTLGIDVERTSVVKQLEGMFDMPEKQRSTVDFHFDVPLEDRDWQVGLIVGPSGAGKSSVARHLFGDAIVAGYDWSRTRSVVDSFGDMPIRESTGALSAVGFSSPPSWLKPFHVLSNGEQFRATLARSIVDPRELVVMDEFTSVVDRNVARIGAAAVAKAVRARKGKQLVAVTCHEDVLEWLQPDWVLEPHLGAFSWRSPQRRPGVEFEIHRAPRAAWKLFSPHHYLAANLHRDSRCWVAAVNGAPAAFCGVLQQPHPIAKHLRRVHRVVVLPDFQGLGLALRLLDVVGAWARTVGYRLLLQSAHPALVRAQAKSPAWRMRHAPRFENRKSANGKTGTRDSFRRVASFEYIGERWPSVIEARAMWGDDTVNQTRRGRASGSTAAAPEASGEPD